MLIMKKYEKIIKKISYLFLSIYIAFDLTFIFYSILFKNNTQINKYRYYYIKTIKYWLIMILRAFICLR